MHIKAVGVVGCGQMGAGIARVIAEAGYTVIVHEVGQQLLERGLARITDGWARAVERRTMSAEAKDHAATRLQGALALEALGSCDLIIEAIIEDLLEKKRLFAALDRVCTPETILATNTSALPVIEMALATARPGYVCGVHFFNPATVMALVEVVRTDRTSEGTIAEVIQFVKSLRKEPIATADSPGFVVNRLLVPYLLDAIRAVEAKVASTVDLDKAMKLGCGYPMGPLALVDAIGLDTLQAIANILSEKVGEPRLAPPRLLRRMVREGLLGKKSGRGFYDYSTPEPSPVPVAA